MKWFKHDSNANNDAKLKKVRFKFGMQGYGLYWYLLELIAARIEKHRLDFDLEHDSEIIAHDTGIPQVLVQEMIDYFVTINLFENSGETITCIKMGCRTDDYIGRIASGRVRINSEHTSNKVLSKSGQTPNKVVVNRLEENREDKNIDKQGNKKKQFQKPSVDEVAAYCQERGNDLDANQFYDHYEANGWVRGKTKIKDWKAAVRTWERNAKQGMKSTSDDPYLGSFY